MRKGVIYKYYFLYFQFYIDIYYTMYNGLIIMIISVLFFILSPGVLFKLSFNKFKIKNTIINLAIVHSIIFTFILYFGSVIFGYLMQNNIQEGLAATTATTATTRPAATTATTATTRPAATTAATATTRPAAATATTRPAATTAATATTRPAATTATTKPAATTKPTTATTKPTTATTTVRSRKYKNT